MRPKFRRKKPPRTPANHKPHEPDVGEPFSLWGRFVAIIPKIRTQIQLASFIVLVAAVLISFIVRSNNSEGAIVGGTMGIVLVVFSFVLGALDKFKASQRAWLATVLFVAFACLVLGLFTLWIQTLRSQPQPPQQPKYRVYSAKEIPDPTVSTRGSK